MLNKLTILAVMLILILPANLLNQYYVAEAKPSLSASITLNPITGPPGTLLTVNGKNFGSRTTVTITFDGIGTVATTTASGAGSFSTTFTVPLSTAVGSQTVTATDPTHIASASFGVAQPALSLSPSSGPINTLVTLFGTGYAPNTVYSYCFQSAASSFCPATTTTTFTTTSGGAIPAGVTISVPATGNAFLDVSQGTKGSNFIISASFAVTTAILILNPSSGPVNTLVTVSGSAFAPNTLYSYCFQSSGTAACPSGTTTTFTTDSTGAIPNGSGTAPTITVPASGNAFVDVSQGTNFIKSAAFTVTTISSSSINLSPNVGTAGLPVIVTGTGFASGSSVTIMFNGNSVDTTTTDANGAFIATFDIPQSYGASGGAKTVQATDASSHTASATFTVTATGTSTLTIASQDIDGNSLPGFFTYVYEHESTPNPISNPNRFTPAAYMLNNQDEYAVAVSPYGNWQFDHWLDTNSPLGGGPSPFTDQTGKSTARMISITSDTTITAVYRNIALVLSQSVGPAGTPVTVTSKAFPANDAVTLKFNGQNMGTTSTSPTGTYSATFVVPSGTSPGRYIVLATDGTNTYDTPFVVGPAPSISLPVQSTAKVGDGVRVMGTNFFPNSLVELSFDGQDIFEDPGPTPYSIATDSSGSFTAIIEMVESVAGSHAIGAKDSFGDSATTSITIIPSATLFPTSGNTGSTVNIYSPQGNGFAGSSTITLSFDGVPLTTSSAITTDATGSFGAQFTIPSSAQVGLHNIRISDTLGNSFTTSFTVTSVGTPAFSVQNVVTGLSCGSNCSPTQFAFIPDNGPTQEGSGTIFVNMKNGVVYAVKNVNGQFVIQPTPFATIPAHDEADAGLLSVAFDPNNYQSTGYAYFLVTVVSNDPSVTPCNLDNTPLVDEVVRYKVTTDSSGNLIADPSVGQQLVIGNIPASCDIDGGKIKFDSHDNLYVSTGENDLAQSADPSAAQDLTSLRGKILRITPLSSPGTNGLLYSIPSDNPFVSSSNPYIRKEIWGYGTRNPYTFDIDSQTGKIYVSDAGLNTWEQIQDFTVSGNNGGYSNYEGPAFGNPQSVPAIQSRYTGIRTMEKKAQAVFWPLQGQYFTTVILQL
jgi:hypothetical protein